MSEIISGHLCFLRWAAPCRANRMHLGQMTREDNELCDHFLRNGGKPEEDLKPLLARCFPNADRKRVEFAWVHGFSDTWSYECVSGSWQQHVGPDEDCCARIGTVQKIYPEVALLRMQSSQDLRYTVNNYGHRLIKGLSFWVHQRTLIQPVGQAAVS